MKVKHIVIGIVVLVILIGLLSVGRFTGTTGTGNWKDTAIACLSNGHQGLAFHFHPTFQILVDGVPEGIPANIGVSGICMAEVHTHDATGTIHVESTVQGKQLSLGDFFSVWGVELEREGYDMTLLVNGKEGASAADLVLTDHQQIVLNYSSQGE